jgi:hypothetical protein
MEPSTPASWKPACRRGKLQLRRVLVVDHDPRCRAARELAAFPGREIVVAEWDVFLRSFLAAEPPPAGEPDDAVVPSPLMPHLMAGWLAGLAGARWPGRAADLVSPDIPVGTPYDALGPDGTRYVSFADWICPTHCVEPLTCPMIRAPRTWEMGDALARYAERLDLRRPTRGPALFTTRHHAFGVGMFGAAESPREPRRPGERGATRRPRRCRRGDRLRVSWRGQHPAARRARSRLIFIHL